MYDFSIEVDLLQVLVFVSISNPNGLIKLETYRSSLYHKLSGSLCQKKKKLMSGLAVSPKVIESTVPIYYTKL